MESLPDWDKDQIDQEMDAIPVACYASKHVRNYAILANQLGLGGVCLQVKIENNRIYFYEPEADRWTYQDGSSSDERSVVLRKLSRYARLPNCTFLYGPSPVHFDPVAEHFPTMVQLVGDKREKDRNAICFIDYVSLGREGNDWSWETIIQTVSSTIGEVPWKEKIERLFWRGTLSDLHFYKEVLPAEMLEKKQFSPRVLLREISNRHPDLIDAQLTDFECPISLANELGVFQKDLVSRVPLRPHMSYKYQIVLDGTWTTNPGYAWRLLSDCCVFKVDSAVNQWFCKGLIPWMHYIPVKTDLSDLAEKVRWARANDDKAQEIALNGRKFALENLLPHHFYDHALYLLEKFAAFQQRADGLSHPFMKKWAPNELTLSRFRTYFKKALPKSLLSALKSLRDAAFLSPQERRAKSIGMDSGQYKTFLSDPDAAVKTQQLSFFGRIKKTNFSKESKASIIECIFEDAYQLGKIPLPMYKPCKIIDIGADVGAFALAAMSHFPYAAIHCYEPRLNLEPYLSVQADAVGAKVYLTAVGLEADALQKKTTTLRSAIERIGEPVDILKLDCGGSDWNLLKDKESLKNVNYLSFKYCGISPNGTLNPNIHEKARKAAQEAGFAILFEKHHSDHTGFLLCKRAIAAP